MHPAASVVLSTFDQPRLLDLALCGYARQSVRTFEIVIADDGSRPDTRELIQARARSFPVPIRHVWQPHLGFWKSAALNRAVLQSRGAQLLFSDGDCVPSRTFVAEHLAAARPRAFVVGGHVRLGEPETREVTPDAIASGRLDRVASVGDRAGLWWMHGKSLAYIALRRPRKPRLLGLNFSVDRTTFHRVNGFDQTYRNSAREDSDLRNRLLLAGARAISLWHRARVIHLFHEPNAERILWKEANRYYRRPDLRPEAPDGLRELIRELGDAARLTGT
jgi:GT2 family glycosyltransferase